MQTLLNEVVHIVFTARSNTGRYSAESTSIFDRTTPCIRVSCSAFAPALMDAAEGLTVEDVAHGCFWS
ncbi:hypothetical protein ATE80_28880 [Streptomyces kanasensis]|uniref:Uncharacterized protein n=1 Tax=Streptomyces kanasensis TaxID=936756 RepID=A0A100Y0S3_9ACTN|nr:hypothetical protein ATE80_28880 [Streptomyces kanasensis]